jgi:hypothetical protein
MGGPNSKLTTRGCARVSNNISVSKMEHFRRIYKGNSSLAQRGSAELRIDRHLDIPDLDHLLERYAKTDPASWAGADRTRLRRVAEARNYKPGWIHYRMLELQGGAAA